MKNHIPFISSLIVLLIVGCSSNEEVSESEHTTATQWVEVEVGIWKATVGVPDDYNLLTASNTKPYKEGLSKLSQTGFPLDKTEISTKVIEGKTYLRFPLEKEEQLYGFGLNFKTVNQRGRIMTLHVDHYGGKDNGRTHAPVPFYVSSNGYGVLIDAARYITVYAGSGVRTDGKTPPILRDRNTDPQWDASPYSDAVEIMVPAKGTNLYVFEGPTPMEAVQRYNLFNGGGYLPPKWGLGFTQRVPTLFSQDDIVNEAKAFEEHDFPLDFIGVEPGWHSMAYPCTFEWDSTRFPNPKGFMETLDKMGLRANLWMNPYVSPVGSLYDKMKPLSGSHTVWNGIVPDFTLPEARQLFKEHFLDNHINIGVSGYKIDEVDGYDRWLWPDVATFPSGISAEQMRQTYGLLVQQMTAEWFKEKNQRTYGLVRASNAGASSFPYVIYNDYFNHRDFITALVNSSYAGVLWTPEVRASKSGEEWLRRMQTVCFSPMAMLNAWSDGTKPWTYPEVEDAVREVALLRSKLLPYLYSTFAQYRFEGKPPFRAMNLVEGFNYKGKYKKGVFDSTKNPYATGTKQDFNDQYMVGDNLLVAPLFTGETTRQVYLPYGKWYDFYTGVLVGEGEVITITPDFDLIPLFVKDGGIIPMIPPQLQMPKSGEVNSIEIRHYGSVAGSFLLYDDDGVSFDYEQGKHSWTALKVQKDNDELKGFVEFPPAGSVFNYKEVTWKYMTE